MQYKGCDSKKVVSHTPCYSFNGVSNDIEKRGKE